MSNSEIADKLNQMTLDIEEFTDQLESTDGAMIEAASQLVAVAHVLLGRAVFEAIPGAHWKGNPATAPAA